MVLNGPLYGMGLFGVLVKVVGRDGALAELFVTGRHETVTAPYVFDEVVGGAHASEVRVGMNDGHEGHVIETFGWDASGTAVPGHAKPMVLEVVVPGPGEGSILGYLRGEKSIARATARNYLFGFYLVDDDLVLRRVLPAHLRLLDVILTVRVLVPFRRLLH